MLVSIHDDKINQNYHGTSESICSKTNIRSYPCQNRVPSIGQASPILLQFVLMLSMGYKIDQNISYSVENDIWTFLYYTKYVIVDREHVFWWWTSCSIDSKWVFPCSKIKILIGKKNWYYVIKYDHGRDEVMVCDRDCFW